MKKNKNRQYSESLLLRLIQETQTLEDLVNFCQLVKTLEAQQDLVITEKIGREVKLQQQRIVYSHNL